MLKIPKIKFVENKKIYFSIVIVLLAITLISCFVFGVNLDIKFKGGTIVTYSYTGDIDTNAVKSTVEDAIGFSVSVQQSEDFATKNQNLVISLTDSQHLQMDVQQDMTASLVAAFPDNAIEKLSDTSVDPSMGSKFFAKSMVALVFSFIVLVVYIGFRFKRIQGWTAGISAICALLFDICMVFASFVICRMPLDDNFVAVVLTTLGYSINNTIVIYDRLRETQRLHGKNMTYAELMNLSINQTLSRCIHTSVTTVTAMVTVCVVAIIFGVTSIISFAFPMIIGMISGVFTSICIAGPLWVTWQEHRSNKKANA